MLKTLSNQFNTFVQFLGISCLMLGLVVILGTIFKPQKVEAFSCAPVSCPAPASVSPGGSCVPSACSGSDCYPNACFVACPDINNIAPTSCGPTAGGSGGSPAEPPKCSPRTKENVANFPYPGISVRFTEPAGTEGNPWAVPSDRPLILRWNNIGGEGFSWLERVVIRWNLGGTFYDTGNGFGQGGYQCVNSQNNPSGPGIICTDNCRGYSYPFELTSWGSIGTPLDLPPTSYTISPQEIANRNWIDNYVRFQVLAYWRQAAGGTNITSIYKSELQDVYFKTSSRNQVSASSSFGFGVFNPTLRTSEVVVFYLNKNETISPSSPKTGAYSITNEGLVKMKWNAADYVPLANYAGFVVDVEKSGTIIPVITEADPVITSIPSTIELKEIPDLSGYAGGEYTIGSFTVSAANDYDRVTVGSPKTIPVKVVLADSQVRTTDFKVLFAAENINIFSRNNQLKIQYDSQIVDNPPPGFAELLAPYWSETNP